MKKPLVMALALQMLFWTCGAPAAEAGETVTVGFSVSGDRQAMLLRDTLSPAVPVPTASSGSITAPTARYAVSNLRVTDRERTSITLMWDSAEYAGPYTVEVRESGTDMGAVSQSGFI